MNKQPNSLQFTFCVACSAMLLASEAEFHVCSSDSHDPVAACTVEMPAPLHIEQEGGRPEPSHLQARPIAIGTSTTPAASVGRALGNGGPGGGPNGGPMGRFVSR